MIASVVVTFETTRGIPGEAIDEISRLPNVEVGELSRDTRRIPLTIDAPDPRSLEETTRKLQACQSVACVDIVFVHFEDASERVVACLEDEASPEAAADLEGTVRP